MTWARTDVVRRADDVADVLAGVDGPREAEVAQLDVAVRVRLRQQDVVRLQVHNSTPVNTLFFSS